MEHVTFEGALQINHWKRQGHQCPSSVDTHVQYNHHPPDRFYLFCFHFISEQFCLKFNSPLKVHKIYNQYRSPREEEIPEYVTFSSPDTPPRSPCCSLTGRAAQSIRTVVRGRSYLIKGKAFSSSKWYYGIIFIS